MVDSDSVKVAIDANKGVPKYGQFLNPMLSIDNNTKINNYRDLTRRSTPKYGNKGARGKEEEMVRASASRQSHNKETCRGAWRGEEDQKLVQAIEIYGPRRWNIVAANAGLNRCGRSCRLRWLNYLRPDIKRGNITDQEEDLILRLHKLLGNRWSLIAGRLPGRTDSEVKNYWNSHLSKKTKLQNQNRVLKMESMHTQPPEIDAVKALEDKEKAITKVEEDSKTTRFIEGDDLFHCANEDPLSLEWMSKFLETDESWFEFA